MVRDVLLTTVMVLLSDFGLLTQADGAIFALVVSVVVPELAPYMLLSVCMFQGAAGLSVLWWYLGTAIVGGCMVVRFLVGRGAASVLNSPVAPLLGMAIIVVLYGTIASFANEMLGGYPQDLTRSPVLVGVLMVGMICIGVISAFELFRDECFPKRILLVVGVLVCNALFVAAVKIFIGPFVFVHASELAGLEEAAQLVVPTSFGFPRITGTYLTPNGFALCYALVALMLLLRANYQKITCRYIFGYFLLGSILSVLSCSKAILIFFGLSIFVLLIHNYKAMLSMTLLLGAAIIVVIPKVGLERFLDGFRIPSFAEGSYRADSWSLTVNSFSLFDWIFGTGLSAWPQFFQQNLGYKLSDPHSYILSIPGTFGILGVFFYCMVALILGKVLFVSSGGGRALAACLLGLFFVKDAVSIPYLLGNTPVTILVWILLSGCLLLSKQPVVRGSKLSFL